MIHVCYKLFLLPKCENKMYLFPSLPPSRQYFHWRTGRAQITLQIWVTATRQMMTGRCLRPQAGVYNYAQDCRQQGRGGWRSFLSPLWAQPTALLCLPRKKLLPQTTASNTRSPQRKLYTAPPTQLTLSLPKCQTEIGINHKRENTRKHSWRVLSSVAVIKSRSWALLLLSPCDWCLASLAVTNTDWSQTLNDFGPNLFKDSSLLCAHKTCMQLQNLWAQSVTAEHRRLDDCRKKRRKKKRR